MSFWKSKNVLVTGGAGFIGSYLTEDLVKSGANVTVVDNLNNGNLENLSNVFNSIDFINADISNLDNCISVTENTDIVMNLAASVYGLEYNMQHHGKLLYYNSILQMNMLEAARINNVNKFLVVSSTCIYPDDISTPTLELDVTTGKPEHGNEGYGWSKRIAEIQATYYHKEYGMEIAIVRPTNAYGGRSPWDENISHVIPALVKKVLDGDNPVIVFGTGNQKRNFLHGTDVSKLMMLITEHYSCAKPVNIGYEEEISIHDLIELICNVANQSPKLIFDTTKPEGRFSKSVDSTLLKKVTNNYKPKITIQQGIEEMITSYEKQFINPHTQILTN